MVALGTRSLTMTIAGNPVQAEVSKVAITSGESDSDFTSFEDAANGGAREYKLGFTSVQDLETGSLWDKVWTASGTVVACVLKPYGNAVASPTQPHFGFNAIVSEPDGDLLGGEADKSATAKFTFEAEWQLEGKPTKITS